MDDVIVIILMLIFSVLGGLSQLKKRKSESQKNASEDPEEIPDFWDTLSENSAFNPLKDAYIQDQAVEEIKEKKQETPFLDFRKEGISAIKKVDISKNEKPGMMMAGKLVKNKKKISGFSLGKAVIYSEILNRKYF